MLTILFSKRTFRQSKTAAGRACRARRSVPMPAVGLLVIGFLLAALPAGALASFTVKSTVDASDNNPGDGVCAANTAAGVKCTLRAAIEESNANPGYPPEVIILPAGTYTLQKGQLTIQASLSLTGENRFDTIIDGDDKSRVIEIKNSGTNPIVFISDVTIRNGTVELIGGAGMGVGEGTYVTLYRMIVADNNADGGQGGGIANLGNLTVLQNTIRNNSSYSKPTGLCVDATFTDRNAGGQNIRAGGIWNRQEAFLKIDRSTISGNCSARGGGIQNLGRMEITNSTISGNKVAFAGGGIMNFGQASIAYTTITQNEAKIVDVESDQHHGHGGGIYNEGDVDIGNSIIAGNRQKNTFYSRFMPGNYSPDCYSDPADRFGFTSFRGNLLGIENEATCNLRDSIWGDDLSFDIVGTPDDPVVPGLESLASNGGPVDTHALRADSPAVDQGTGITSAAFFDCPGTDQRGFVRAMDGDADGNSACDIGAFELGSARRVALMVVGSTALNAGDLVLKFRLEAVLGYGIEIKAGAEVATADALNKDVVVISESVASADVNTKFRDVRVGVVSLEPAIFDDMQMTGSNFKEDFGVSENQQTVQVLLPNHPLAAGMSGGVLRVTNSGANLVWGNPVPGALRVASLPGQPKRAAIFAYPAGVPMAGIPAPAKRVGFFAHLDTPAALTIEGLQLLDAAVRWAAEDNLALLVVGQGALSPSDVALRQRLNARGYLVEAIAGPQVSAANAEDKVVVVVSESTVPETVAGRLKDVPVGVVSLEPALFDDLGMTGPTIMTDYGDVLNQQSITIVANGHPLAGGNPDGNLAVTSALAKFVWGVPNAAAIRVAMLTADASNQARLRAVFGATMRGILGGTITSMQQLVQKVRATAASQNRDRLAIFGYLPESDMVGAPAPARRVGFFAGGTTPQVLTNDDGWLLFDAAVNWAAVNDN
jgi:CSLREA domain-containing protein